VSNSISSKLKSDSFWVAFGFAVNATSSLFISIILARVLDPESVGLYFLAFSISIIFSGILQFGFNITVVRLISASIANNKLSELRNTLINLLLLIMFLSGLLAFFFMTDMASDFFKLIQKNQSLSTYIPLIGFWVLFISIRSYLAEVFRGFHDIKMAAIYQRILPNIVVVIAIFLFYIADIQMDLYFVLYMSMITNALLVLFALYPFYKKISVLPKGQQVSLMPMIHSSAPIAVGQIFQFIVTQTPLWVLGAVSTADKVADYGVAFRLAAVISLPLLIANNVVMPHVSKYHSTDNTESLNKLIRYAVTITSFISIALLLVYVVLGEEVLVAFYGPGYNAAYIILIIIGCAHVVNVASGSPAVVLAMACKEKYVFYSSVLAAIVTFLLSIVVIPEYGLIGAAFTTAFGLIFLNALLVFFSYKILGYKTYLSINSVQTTIKRVL